MRHCVESVRIWNFSGPYFPAFGLNTERCGESLSSQSKCGNIRTRKTPNKDTFHVVINFIEYQLVGTLSNVYDGNFCENSYIHKDVSLKMFNSVLTLSWRRSKFQSPSVLK